MVQGVLMPLSKSLVGKSKAQPTAFIPRGAYLIRQPAAAAVGIRDDVQGEQIVRTTREGRIVWRFARPSRSRHVSHSAEQTRASRREEEIISGSFDILTLSLGERSG